MCDRRRQARQCRVISSVIFCIPVQLIDAKRLSSITQKSKVVPVFIAVGAR
jgi:hypothetical protein